MFSISVETKAGVTRHHLDSAIDALAIVEDIQKQTHLPIVITNRATGRVLNVEELTAGWRCHVVCGLVAEGSAVHRRSGG